MGKHGVRSFLIWLPKRTEVNIAVVCHYNVIKWLLNNAVHRVPNCTPIECILTNDGELFLKSKYNDPNFKDQIQEKNLRNDVVKLNKKNRRKKLHKKNR